MSNRGIPLKPHTEEVRGDLVVEKNPIPKAPRLPCTVNYEVKEWLKVSVKHHWYLYWCRETNRLRIAFFNHNDAMMWKLAWH